MQFGMLESMQSTSVRIDLVTHDRLKRLSSKLEVTVGETVALAVLGLIQEQMGKELSAPLTAEETEWLDADLG